MKNIADRCNGCQLLQTCSVRDCSTDLKTLYCTRSKKEEVTRSNVPDPTVEQLTLQMHEYMAESMKQLTDKNFNANYCQKCAIRNKCALMKLEERIRQQLCFHPCLEKKLKADIDPYILTKAFHHPLN